MNKYLICLIAFALTTLSITAQLKDSAAIAFYSDNFPQEKVHLHTDKEAYLPGDIIWFKAYIMADELPSSFSTNFYADLLDAQGKLIQHKTMPVLAATADNFFTLPDSSTGNSYTIRAYTSWMLNFDTTFIYHKTISIINPDALASAEKPEVSLRFFAESGNFVAGLYNYLTFKATHSTGLPYNIAAVIKNSKNEVIDSITSVHDGMGTVNFIPEAGETYIAEWKDNKGEYRRTTLPAVQPQGILLHTQQVKNDLYYLVNATSSIENFQQLTVVATMFQKLVYQAKIKTGEAAVNQKINTQTFPDGVLQLTVYDKNNQPLAERVVFINHDDYSFKAQLNIDQKGLDKRGNNKITIAVADTLSANLSVAVYDANLEQASSGKNIYTDLLLQGDIRGEIYKADWYFNDTATNTHQYLDLVMQTNGWRRYNWESVITGQTPTTAYPRDSYLNIYGKATDAQQQGVANQMVNLIVQTKDSAKQWYLPVTTKDGSFTQGGLIFYDTATVLYKLNNSKEKIIALGLAKDYNGLVAMKAVNLLPAYLQQPVAATENTPANTYTKTFITELNHKNPGFEQKAKVMNEVVVKSKAGWNNWKNDPLLKMDEKYTSMFRGIGASNVAIDVMHDEMAASKSDIYNYLMGKVPGVSVIYQGTRKTIVGPCVFCRGAKGPVSLFLNENPIDNDMMDNLNIENIAYIKYYESTPWLQGLPASLSIYTKKSDDFKEDAKKLPSNLIKMKLAGYSPVKEFYSPDYSVAKDNQANADLRSTLYWQPYIITNKENPAASFSFYNNDITTRFKVVIEGMNEEGKLIHIEKIIE
ncbi:MAG: hypothetical protein WCI49_02865 [Ferruginibacter sp.]